MLQHMDAFAEGGSYALGLALEETRPGRVVIRDLDELCQRLQLASCTGAQLGLGHGLTGRRGSRAVCAPAAAPAMGVGRAFGHLRQSAVEAWHRLRSFKVLFDSAETE